MTMNTESTEGDEPEVVRTFGQEIGHGLMSVLQCVGAVLVILAIGVSCGKLPPPWR